MANVDPIIVAIQADMADFKRDMADVKKAIKGAEVETKKGSKAFGAMGKALGAVATAATAAATATGVLAHKQLEAARASDLWAKRLNVARSTFNQLAAVGSKFGASVDDVGDAIKDLNERIADAAAGNKTYEEALNRVGLASKNLINLPVEEQFLKVADAIGKMNNAGDKNFVTAELMADAGFRLIPMFEAGEKAIRRMGDEALRTNEALSAFQLAELEKVNKATMEMSRAVEALGNALAIHLAPGLKLAAEWAQKLAGYAADALGTSETAMRDRLKEVNEELQKLTHIGVVEKEQLKARGGSVSLYNKQVRRKIGLMQEMRQLEMSLQSIDESSIVNETAKAEAIERTNQAITNQLDLNKVFEEELSKSGGLNLTDIFKKAAEEGSGEEEDINAVFADMLGLNGPNLATMREHFEEAKQMEEEYMSASHKLWMQGWKGKSEVTSKFLGQISQLMNTNSRKQFEIGKAAAIAQVAIDTPKAAMSAYSAMAGIPYIGPILGAAAAAAAIASGVSQIQNIKSTSFGGGGGLGGGAVDAGGAGGTGAQQAAPENVLDATFNIQGTSVSTDQIRGVANGLNELIDDGYRLRTVKVI